MNIALIGYGKMGRAIESIALEEGDTIVLRQDVRTPTDEVATGLQKAEVAIEFSGPSGAFDNITTCLKAGVPVVSGSTGWLDRKPEVEELVRQLNGAFFYAANYSVGVHLFFAVNQYLARLMNEQPQYGVRLHEVHHTAKVDAPSGTAIHAAEDILRLVDRKSEWIPGPTDRPEALAVTSERIDPTPGTHTVCYESAIDDLTIQHVAHSREGFARGALQAAHWLVGKSGSFGMASMLGF